MGAQDSHASGAANVSHQIKKDTRRCPFLFGAGSGGRTHTVLLPPDFESGASANSTIPAWNTILLYNSRGFISSKKFHSLPPRCPQPVKRGGGARCLDGIDEKGRTGSFKILQFTA